jgi:pheromone shutdown protein TraB
MLITKQQRIMVALLSLRTISKDGTTIHLLGTIQGLVSEKEKVKSAFHRTRPDLVALGVSSEYLETLMNPAPPDETFDEISGLEEIYLKKLAEYGEIDVPPADLTAAMQLSNDENVPIIAVDMNDDECMKAYTGSLSKWPIVISTFFAPFRIRRMRKQNFRAKNAEDFVREFDTARQKIRGFRRLEKQRETSMAKRLAALANEHKTILAIVEAQRVEGVLSVLSKTQ